eukprot:TRINITY_DN7693_c0_g1_i1.p1 TRINITY_DN7693_c0_g1~~TRINITY_DN7693_c0_g1_i1.p1  ORF type:complete len:517 (-),score=99.22 TRINITY_DN7693_c0_g1_i1:283-1833(-)
MQAQLCLFVLCVFFVVRDHSAESLFGSKQTYSVPKSEEMPTIVKEMLQSNQCRERYIDLNARHGTRFPSRGESGRINALKEKIHLHSDTIQNPVYDWMKSWSGSYDVTKAMYLAPQGVKEHHGLGERMASRFPRLFPDPYDPEAIYVQHTQSARAGQSAQAFMQGLYGNSMRLMNDSFIPFFTVTESPSQDYTLSFFNLCPVYADTVHGSYVYLKHAEEFKSKQFPKITEKVSSRLQLSDQWVLSVDDMLAMHSACRFDMALNGSSNPIQSRWCSVFDEDDLRAIEYFEDLEFYHAKGYGADINHEMAGLLVSDILQGMQSFVEGRPSKKQSGKKKKEVMPIYSNARIQNVVARLRFSHAETLLPLLCLLDFNRDTFKFDAKASPHQRSNRKFDTGEMIPFAGNVAFVLYECNPDSSTSSTTAPSHFVRTLHNEVDVVLPGCPSNLCPYADFVEILQSKALSEKQFEQLCSVQARSSSSSFDSIPTWAIMVVGLGSAFLFTYMSITVKSRQRTKRK